MIIIIINSIVIIIFIITKIIVIIINSCGSIKITAILIISQMSRGIFRICLLACLKNNKIINSISGSINRTSFKQIVLF